jgi:hypothetical protein
MKDNIVILDSVTKEKVIFNELTFKTLIKGILEKYANKSESEAKQLISEFKYFSKPIQSINDALFFSHESEYHWAMVIAYGEQYWQKGIDSEAPDEYDEWEKKYIKAYNLSQYSFEWD